MAKANRILATLSLVLALYANLRYALGRAPVEKNPEDDPFYRVGFTPFTANILVLLIYWGFLHLLQLSFVAQYFFPESTSSTGRGVIGSILGAVDQAARLKVADDVGPYFTVFNLLQFAWTMLFAHGHYIWAELVVIVNFFNILALYNTQKTYGIKNFANYFLIHMPVTALPFSWLLYVIFWNGAVVVGSNSLAARIVANVFIWDFLLVPGFNLVIYRDWAIGLSSAALVLALALGQFFTRFFALQWLFAFIISGVLFLSSVAVLAGNLKNESSASTDAETAPLINN